MLNCVMDSNLNFKYGGSTGETISLGYSGWNYWQDYYYPQIIRESYPIYVRERAEDKGKKAYEIIKILKDKKIIRLNTVAEFVDAMDELIKIL